ncbi:MAG: hypothetical protein U1E51_12625 [Candidatus Binatia bacterium]|nr:hypothetical protein [Candidatus Binatia bacterium]
MTTLFERKLKTLKLKSPASAYLKRLPIMGREDPYNKDVLRFWVDVPNTHLVDVRYPKLLLGWCLLRLFWHAWQQGGPVGKDTP